MILQVEWSFGPPCPLCRRIGQVRSWEIAMGRVPGIEIIRRAYKIWEDSGKPEGKDEEFYLRAERELEEELTQHDKAPDSL
jgi:hypothetical protein